MHCWRSIYTITSFAISVFVQNQFSNFCFRPLYPSIKSPTVSTANYSPFSSVKPSRYAARENHRATAVTAVRQAPAFEKPKRAIFDDDIENLIYTVADSQHPTHFPSETPYSRLICAKSIAAKGSGSTFKPAKAISIVLHDIARAAN